MLRDATNLVTLLLSGLLLYAKLSNQNQLTCATSASILACLVFACLLQRKVTFVYGLTIVVAWTSFALQYFEQLTLSLYAVSLLFSCCVVLTLNISTTTMER